MKKNLIYLFVTLSLFVACHKVDVQSNKNSSTTPSAQADQNSTQAAAVRCDAATVYPLVIKGGKEQVGTVTIHNNSANYIITYNTFAGYTLKRTDVFIGSCDNLPFNRNGDVDFSQFQNSTKHKDVTTFTYTIPVSAIGIGNCGCIVAHAKVIQQVDDDGISAYAQTDNNIPGNKRAFSISSCPCSDPAGD